MRHIDVLLIEDNSGDAKLVRHHLENPLSDSFFDEIALTHIETLSAGEAELAAATYDILLLDLGLSESTGLDTLERVLEFTESTPVIVLTGLSDTSVATEAISVGAQDYLQKADLDGDRLVRSLRYAIDRHEQEQRLQRQNERLDFFNSILRHDMLNGLNIVMAEADMLEADLEDPERLERARAIREWSEDIVGLSEKVRAILEAVTDDDAATLEPVSLVDAVATGVDRADAVTDRVHFEVDLPDSCDVRANDLLDDVVGNLLMNAVDHTDSETNVSVRVTANHRDATLSIADDGSGISPERRSSIFERGSKGEASTGTGFGLFFVSSMVESYDGSVDLTESDDGGAAFDVTIPLAPDAG